MDYLKEIENELSNNYDGFDGEDEENYIGELPGMVAKVSQGTTDSFKFNLRNTTGTPKKIAILAGYLNTGRPAIPDVDGKVEMLGGGKVLANSAKPFMLYDAIEELLRVEAVDAVICDGINGVIWADAADPAKVITATAEDFAIADFSNFVKHVPSIVKDIVVNVNDQNVFSSTLKVKRISPFNSEGSFNINLSDSLSANQNIDKKITIDTVAKYGRLLQLDAHTLIIFNMPGNVNGQSDVSASFQFNLTRKFDISDLNMRNAIASFKPVAKKVTPIKK